MYFLALSAIHNDRPSKPTQAKRLLLHPDLGGCCNTGSVAVPCRYCSLHPDLTAAAAMLPAWRLWAVRVWACFAVWLLLWIWRQSSGLLWAFSDADAPRFNDRPSSPRKPKDCACIRIWVAAVIQAALLYLAGTVHSIRI